MMLENVGKRFSKPQVDFAVVSIDPFESWEKVLKTPSRLSPPPPPPPPTLGKGSQNPK